MGPRRRRQQQGQLKRADLGEGRGGGEDRLGSAAWPARAQREDAAANPEPDPRAGRKAWKLEGPSCENPLWGLVFHFLKLRPCGLCTSHPLFSIRVKEMGARSPLPRTQVSRRTPRSAWETRQGRGPGKGGGVRGALKSERQELRGNSTGRARACTMRSNEYEITATARQRREGLERAGVRGVPPWAPQRHLLPFPAPSRPPSSASADAAHADLARRTPRHGGHPVRSRTPAPRLGLGLGTVAAKKPCEGVLTSSDGLSMEVYPEVSCPAGMLGVPCFPFIFRHDYTFPEASQAMRNCIRLRIRNYIYMDRSA
ncbi:uncharacterized protein LOC117098767 [Trachypithecus francoisi]|uniref:uncharacterized protein LOC117098767 n=1 Tax=Trachypithecus francoisi TaxID=54180 RepID=UPI00141BA9AC|nr:uncharacterized protein LOC117098767 [Trachypithecus francoisi]